MNIIDDDDDLSEIECKLRQLEICFEKTYAEMIAIVSLRGEELARVRIGRARSVAQLRKALERLVHYLVDVLPTPEDLE